MELDNLLLHVNYGLTSGKVIHNCAILCRKGKIFSIGGASAFNDTHFDYRIDLPNCYATPGFIDPHLYGFKGFSIMDDNTEDSVKEIAAQLPSHGVTTFLPSMHATSTEKELKILDQLKNAKDNSNNYKGSRIAGIHMVGPFISSAKRGTNPAEGIRPFDEGELNEIIAAGGHALKIMTFAPEVKGAIRLIEILRENNITPSMGNSIATAEHVIKAIDAGAQRCTHLYNCMNPLHQRQIGLASTSLVDDRITVELIFDGFHIHPQMIDLACRVKSKGQIIAVSAGTIGTGLKDGEYTFSGRKITIENQHCRLADGTIAGSMITQEQAWRNVLDFTHYKPQNAISCFTSNPARDLGFQDRGFLQPGLNADIVLLNENHEVELTLVNGEIAYIKNPEIIKKNEQK
jgi:N-acetylglucosamine-6-phosphate deacetylase